ncbi:sulfite exporter TauE/SafE family protein [Rhabdobacter roseus]|uniref:Urease accessory protein UreH-like transmembrane domain-containing protein n=1 Tax=Rhabdobacter roseus TaxID=1655419 RepID=A0A840TF82_9BACT|nr:sulfite exporter TauE/SafE family protein [Rhabdobacter roseus]MBB5282776.1 hypothetical protein [Rhabdobacter roseus]
MTTWLPYLAFSMGLLSSFHCVGMCGPIALALPIHRGSRAQQVLGLLAYNGGRALTYALLGSLFGLLGSSFLWMGYLRYVTLAVGVLMVGYVLWPAYLERHLRPPGWWQRAVQRVKGQMARLLGRRHVGGWVLLGSLNGLLPCGMVYMAVISSVATGSALNGGLFMFTFGLGTLPAMMAVGYFKQWFTPPLRTRLRRLTPFLLALAGTWIVARSLFIQPPGTLPHAGTSTEIPVCHGAGK